MSLKKLTDLNKQEILRLYRETRETTTSLAKRFDVSTTTIVRWLKLQLSESEYDYLVQQKRLGRTHKLGKQLNLPLRPATSPPLPVIVSLTKASLVVEEEKENPEKVDLFAFDKMLEEDLPTLEDDEEDLPTLEEEEEDLPTLEEEEEDLPTLEDEEDDEEDLDEGDEEDWEEEADVTGTPSLTVVASLDVLPLSEAAFPKTCYLVIDRAAELIARPLKEFADLGNIPPEEVQQKTLPIFDSHRVARRFSNRFQRVIKVPDSRVLHKTSSHLRAKGITRILMDGQIYSLPPC